MRLTLRTMLAYLDDILDPEDATQLGQKITESDFASDLVYRTLSSKRRVNLSAPRLDGTGIGSDPNSVAEYLDNTLEESRIPELEKICLESEMHLGEVASCHTILTKVVEEPIEIDDALRTRLIQLIHAKELKAPVVAVSASPLPQDVAPANTTADYMPSNAPPLWRALVVLTFFALVIIIGLRAIGPLDESHMIIGPLFKADPSSNEGPQGDIEAPVENSQSTQMINPIGVIDPEIVSPTVSGPNVGVDLGNPDQFQGNDGHVRTSVLGEFLADHELLVAVDPQTGTFERVVSAAIIGPGMTLQTFASFRPEITLRSGARLMLVNTSELLIPNVVDGFTQLHLRHGCLVLRGEATRKTIVPLRVGDREIDVHLTGPESLVTVQVSPSDSSTATSAQWVVQIHCTSAAQWQDRGVAAAQLGDGQAVQATTIQANGTMKTTMEMQLPKWYLDSQILSASQRQTAQELVSVLSDSSELSTDLRKAFETHRLLQVQIVAARCLMHLGEFNPIMDTLNNADYRSTWEDSVAAISKCMKLDAMNMELVFAALQSRAGDQTMMIAAMLGTCTDEQLQGDLGEAMVQGLDSTVMLERVISFTRLKNLTGKTQMYFPDKNPNQQVVPIRRWQQLWTDKKLQRQESVTKVSYLIP
jgi:hypothetical protein